MSRPRLRAVVLCAGLGLRLRPLTEVLPKPLLPIRGRSVLVRTLRSLEAAGCEAVAINLHHLGGSIREAVGSRRDSLEVVYSEEPELLGTLGALAALRAFLEPADYFFLVNGDSLCDWPFALLLERHLESGAEATLLLHESADVATFGGVGVDGGERVRSFPGGPESESVVSKRVFAGAHVLSASLLEGVETRFAGIVDDLYLPALERGAILQGLRVDLDWHDLGTARRYLEAALSGLGEQAWVSPSAAVDPTASLKGSAVEGSAAVESECRVSGSLLLPGSRLRAGSSVRDSIVGPGVELPAKARLEGSLVTASSDGTVSELTLGRG